MGRRVRGEQNLAQRLVEGIVEEVDVLPFDRIVLAFDPVLVRQAQPVGPVEQFVGRGGTERIEYTANPVTGGVRETARRRRTRGSRPYVRFVPVEFIF